MTENDIVEDVYVELMARMDDKTLLNYCITHPYNRQLSNRDDIWLPRINSIPGLNLLLPYRSHYKNLQDFYFNVRKDAHYVLMDFEDTTYYPEIIFVKDVDAQITDVSYSIRAIFDMFESLSVEEQDFICIVIRFNNVLDHNNIKHYIIYSRNERFPNYKNLQILQYPELLKRSYHAVVLNTVDTGKVQYFPTFSVSLTPSDNTTTQNNDNPEMSGRIIHVEEHSKQVRHKMVETFIEFDTASLRIAHSNNLYVRLYKDIVGSEEAGTYTNLGWISFGYITRTRNRNIVLLIDLGLLDLKPPEYGIVVTDEFALGPAITRTVIRKITETPEQLLSDQKIILTDLIMLPSTEIFSLTEFSLIIDKYKY